MAPQPTRRQTPKPQAAKKRTASRQPPQPPQLPSKHLQDFIKTTPDIEFLNQTYTIQRADESGEVTFTDHIPGASFESYGVLGRQAYNAVSQQVCDAVSKFVFGQDSDESSICSAFPQASFQFLKDSVERDLKDRQNKYGLVDLRPDVSEADLRRMVLAREFNYLNVAGPKTFRNLKDRSIELSNSFNEHNVHESVDKFFDYLASDKGRQYHAAGTLIIEAIKEADFASIQSLDDFRNIKVSSGKTLEDQLNQMARTRFRHAETRQKYVNNELNFLYEEFQVLRITVAEREKFLAYGATAEELQKNPALQAKNLKQFLSRESNVNPNFLLMAAIQGDVQLYDYKDVSRFIREMQTSDGPNDKYKQYRDLVANERVSTHDLLTAVYGKDAVREVESNSTADICFTTKPPAGSLAAVIAGGEALSADIARVSEVNEDGTLKRKKDNNCKVVGKDVDLTNRLIGEVRTLQDPKQGYIQQPSGKKVLDKEYQMFAAGIYQMMEDKIPRMVEAGLFKENDYFDLDRQDLGFMFILEKDVGLPQLYKQLYERNRTPSKETFNQIADSLAIIWASVEDKKGNSAHASSGNKPLTKRDVVLTTLLDNYKKYASYRQKDKMTHEEAAHFALTGRKKKQLLTPTSAPNSHSTTEDAAPALASLTTQSKRPVRPRRV